MAFGRRLLTRLRGRFSGAAPKAGTSPPGAEFSPPQQEQWDELEEQVDSALKKIGSAVVQTWEVGAAELGRVSVGRVDDRVLVERYSDALVPFLTPFQDLHKKCPTAMAEGKRVGIERGSIPAAVAPLNRMVDGLDTAAEAGWIKTAEYLGPLFDACVDPAASRADFITAGPKIAEACRVANDGLKESLRVLPAAESLWDGMLDAFERYQEALGRDMEILLDGKVKALARGIKR